MCKFHQDIALDVATGADGSVNPTIYALNIIALGANCSIRHYMPEMKGVKGSMTYKLASQECQTAFKNSGLVYEPAAFEAYRSETLPALRNASQEIIQTHGFDQKRPSVIKGRIKSFLQVAPDELYAPLDNLTPNVFKTPKQAEQYQGLRLAVADYWATDGVAPALKERFKQSVSVLFSEAPAKTNPALLKAYEVIPDKLKAFGDCAGGVCSSAGGTLLGHLGCIAKAVVLPALSATSTVANDPMVMYSLMGAGTVLGLGAWQLLHYQRGTLPGKLEKAMTYGAAIISLGALTAWHSLDDHHHHEYNHFQETKIPICGMDSAQSSRPLKTPVKSIKL
jgi:hypothetical protein